jgi:hypothetical protein
MSGTNSLPPFPSCDPTLKERGRLTLALARARLAVADRAARPHPLHGSINAIALGAPADSILSTALVRITVGLELLAESKLDGTDAALGYSLSTHKEWRDRA